jgi:stage II sporulation protein D
VRLAAIGASGVAPAVALACAAAAPRAPARATEEPELRVAVALDAQRVEVAGQGRLLGVVGGEAAFTLDAGEVATLEPEGAGLRLSHGRGQRQLETVTFTVVDPAKYVAVDGRPYRGVVEAFARNGRVTVVDRVGLEDYLLGVVAREMGRREASEAAALRAQAIVSRTYALRNRGRFGAQGYDVQAGVADQAYAGVAGETPEATAAVRATTGEVLTYGGEPIHAFFHSTCGYRTAVPREAFRAVTDAPYLRSVSDQKPGGYYCDLSPRFRWRVEWDAATLRDILRRTVPAVVGVSAAELADVQDVRVHATGRSGRATEIRIRVPRGEIPVFGPDIRQVLLAPDGGVLGSNAVQLTTQHEGERLARLAAAGAGWGHGVGLCQWGAIGRARAGQDHRTILATYFPGTRLERWY